MADRWTKWQKSKRSKRMPTHKIPAVDSTGMRFGSGWCLHKRYHRIKSGDLWCPTCLMVVGYDEEDR
jgi:hypothetical protein